MLTATVVDSLVSAQSKLALHHPKEWREGLDLMRSMFADEFADDRCDPFRVAELATRVRRAWKRPESEPTAKVNTHTGHGDAPCRRDGIANGGGT